MAAISDRVFPASFDRRRCPRRFRPIQPTSLPPFDLPSFHEQNPLFNSSKPFLNHLRPPRNFPATAVTPPRHRHGQPRYARRAKPPARRADVPDRNPTFLAPRRGAPISCAARSRADYKMKCPYLPHYSSVFTPVFAYRLDFSSRT